MFVKNFIYKKFSALGFFNIQGHLSLLENKCQFLEQVQCYLTVPSSMTLATWEKEEEKNEEEEEKKKEKEEKEEEEYEEEKGEGYNLEFHYV